MEATCQQHKEGTLNQHGGAIGCGRVKDTSHVTLYLAHTFYP